MNFWLIFIARKQPKNVAKIGQNDKISKFSKIDFFIMVQDMNIGVGLDENTSLGYVLSHLSYIYHPSSKNAPAIFQNHENVVIFARIFS